MKSAHLNDFWSSPDNSRLISKQFSFRLPVHIAAKIAALCEMYPQKNRTQIVADLLTVALDDLEKSLPYVIEPVNPIFREEYFRDQYESGMPTNEICELNGKRAVYRMLSNKYFNEFEKELGNETPVKLYEHPIGSYEDVENALK